MPGYTIVLVVTMTLAGAPQHPAAIITDVPDDPFDVGLGWPNATLPEGLPSTPDDSMCLVYETRWRDRAMATLERGGPSSATYSFRCSVLRRL